MGVVGIYRVNLNQLITQAGMRREGALSDPAIYMWPSRSGDLLVFPGYNIYMVGGLAHATFLL